MRLVERRHVKAGQGGNVRRGRPRDKSDTSQNRSWYLYGTLLEFHTVFQPGGKGGPAASLVTNGVTAQVSRAIGAGDPARARAAGAQAINLALLGS